MLEIQYIRGILVVNNLVSLIISFIVGDFYFGLASVLLVSWLQSVITVSYTAYKLKTAKKEAYFRVPLAVDEFGIPLGDMSEKPKMGSKMAATNLTMDVLFTITLASLVPMSMAVARDQAEDLAAVGGLVALVIHLFFIATSLDFAAITKYKLKIMIVPRNPDTTANIAAQTATSAEPATSTEAAMKEQRLSEETILEGPEQLSPRPYRGSPSTKPSKTSNLSSDGPIRLIEPTEGDYLIAERD